MSNLSRLLKASAKFKNRIANLEIERDGVLNKMYCLNDNIRVLNRRYAAVKERLDEGFTKEDIEKYLKGNWVDVTV